MCVSVTLALAAMALPAPAAPSPDKPVKPDNAVENAVVQVFSTISEPDLTKPWTKREPREVSGSGVIIAGQRILTNAHVVLYASQIQVQANHSGTKVSATLQAIAPGIDLAILKPDDPKFFEGHGPLACAPDLPAVKDEVLAYGFPKGGSSLSITKGIVSRIEFVGSFSNAGLRIQVDAAINPGNSGGPAVAGEKMVGLVFSRLERAENIGYIVPCEEIDLFFADVADGTYDGKPGFYDQLQTLENEALRPFLKLDRSVEGIVVLKVDSPEPGYPLKEWDVISRIGETPVDEQGRIELKGGTRLSFRYLVQKLAKNGKVPLTIWRAGKQLTVQVPVPIKRQMLMPGLDGRYPSYFVHGPMVFSVATRDFLDAAHSKVRRSDVWSGLLGRVMDRPGFPGEEPVVFASPLFPHKLSKGYDSPLGQVVSEVNGVKVKNLPHLVELLRDSRSDYVVITSAGRNSEKLVFPAKEMAAATERILTDSGIRAQGSADVMAVWNARAGAKP